MTHQAKDRSGWDEDPSFYFHPGELPTRPKRSSRALLGNGRLATERDLETLLTPPSEADRGLMLRDVTPLVEDEHDSTKLHPLIHRGLHLPLELRERHVLAVGQTGCGKTARLILPQLAADLEDPRRAIITLDAKGGVFHEVLSRLAIKVRPGAVVHRINPSRRDRSTIRWNPVRGIKSRSDALAVAHAVCVNVDSGMAGAVNNEAFWLFSSINLLADLLLALAKDPKQNASFTRAKELVDGFPTEMAEFAEAHPKGYPAIYRVLENHSQNPSTSIIADLAMRMMLFDDEGVAEVTGGPDELDLERLIETSGVLVIEIFEADAARLIPLTNLLLGRTLDKLLTLATARPDGKLARPLTLTLDELGSACGKIHQFETRISTLRSRGVSIVGAVQTLGQLEHLYGKSAESIAANFGTKIFFGGGLGIADARHASELSGTMTVDLASEPGTGLEAGLWTGPSLPMARAVLLPDEVARPRVHPLLGSPTTIITPDLPPFQAYLPASYELPRLASALSPHRWSGEPGFTPPKTPRVRPIVDVEQLQRDLGWARLEGPALRYWKRLEQRTRIEPRRLLLLLRKLAQLQKMGARVLGATGSILAEFHATRWKSATKSRRGHISYLEWTLIRRLEQLNRGQGGPSIGPD